MRKRLRIELRNFLINLSACSISCQILVNYAHVLRWPIDKSRFTIDQVAIHWAKLAAVGRDRPMISHDEVLIRRNHHRIHRTRIPILLWDIRLTQSLAVDIHSALVDAQPVAGDGNDELNIALLRIAW